MIRGYGRLRAERSDVDGCPSASSAMLDVSFPTTDGRRLVMPRYTEPEPEQALLLHHLKLALPQQPPPRISALSPTAAAALPPLKM